MTLAPALETVTSWPPAYVWATQFVLVYAALLIMLRLFGQLGAAVFMICALIGANMLAPEAVEFARYDHMAMQAAIVFSATFMAAHVLTEFYGFRAAMRASMLSVLAFAVLTLMVVSGLGFQAGEGSSVEPHREALEALFVPEAALFEAGMIAFLAGQLLNIWLFRYIRRRSEGRHLWLRNIVATVIASTAENTLFAVLALVVFAAGERMDMSELIFGHVLALVWVRWIIAGLNTPFIYMARLAAPGAERRAAAAG